MFSPVAPMRVGDRERGDALLPLGLGSPAVVLADEIDGAAEMRPERLDELALSRPGRAVEQDVGCAGPGRRPGRGEPRREVAGASEVCEVVPGQRRRDALAEQQVAHLRLGRPARREQRFGEAGNADVSATVAVEETEADEEPLLRQFARRHGRAEQMAQFVVVVGRRAIVVAVDRRDQLFDVGRARDARDEAEQEPLGGVEATGFAKPVEARLQRRHVRRGSARGRDDCRPPLPQARGRPRPLVHVAVGFVAEDLDVVVELHHRERSAPGPPRMEALEEGGRSSPARRGISTAGRWRGSAGESNVRKDASLVSPVDRVNQ